MVPLCETIDEHSIFWGKVGSSLILRSPGKKSTAELPIPPATIMPEILPKSNNNSINFMLNLLLFQVLMYALTK